MRFVDHDALVQNVCPRNAWCSSSLFKLTAPLISSYRSKQQGEFSFQQQVSDNGENQKLIRSLALSEQDRRARSASGNPEEDAGEASNLNSVEPIEQQKSPQQSIRPKVKQEPNLVRRPFSLTVDVTCAVEGERTVVQSPKTRGDKARVRSAGAVRSGSSANLTRPSEYAATKPNFYMCSTS